jgi:hypothetical protein
MKTEAHYWISRFTLALILVVSWQSGLRGQVLETTRAGLYPNEIEEIKRALNCKIDSKNLRSGMRLGDLMSLVEDGLHSQKSKVRPWLLGFDSEFLDTRLQFPPMAKEVTVATVLKVTIEGLPRKATLVTRPGILAIAPIEHNLSKSVLQQNVNERFDKVPLEDALHTLSQSSGVSIVIDPKAKERAKSPVTATFYNATLRGATIVLADMAQLRCVFIDNVIYVTDSKGHKRLKEHMP